ncbi:MAG TPA: sigma factor [Actinomycetota bacterium]|nr:sigma factor [Actinomycetota bacterium]
MSRGFRCLHLPPRTSVEQREEHYGSLLRLCILLSGNRQVAEDIVQDAFVRVAPKLAAVDPEHTAPYLRKVALNLWKNRLRSLTRVTPCYPEATILAGQRPVSEKCM